MIKDVLTTAAIWWVIVTNHFRETYHANKCGHITKLKGLMYDGIKKVIWRLPLSDNGNPNYCLDCVGDMSILCAWCNQPITVGSLVTLYEYDRNFIIPRHAIHCGTALVGCLRQNCTHKKEDVRGVWVHGKVKKLSPSRRSRLLKKIRGWK